MKRSLIAAGVLVVLALTIGVGGFVGDTFAADRRSDEFLVIPPDYLLTAWGWGALSVLLVVPVAQQASVLIAWRWQVVKARRALAERIEAEAPKLADYGRPVIELRVGRPPVRPDAVANRAA